MANPGDKQWEVEWAPRSAKNDAIQNDPDGDLSLLQMEFRSFPNKGLAIAYAKRIVRTAWYCQLREQVYAKADGLPWHEWQDIRNQVDIEVSLNKANEIEVTNA